MAGGQLTFSFAKDKKCRKCGKVLPATEEFFPLKTKRFGNKYLVSPCRSCKNAQGVARTKANIEKYRAIRKTQYAENLEKSRKRGRDCYHRNKERFNAKQRDAYHANLEESRAANREKRKRLRQTEKGKAYAKEYVKKNKAKLLAQDNMRRRKRRAEDPTFRLSENMSAGIWQSLKNGKRGRHWETLVGYTAEQLIAHLESLFLPGMTWGNYGKFGWHVDHILPIASFDFASTDDEQFHKCWALSNLRPLWWIDNLRKKDKIIGAENGPTGKLMAERGGRETFN